MLPFERRESADVPINEIRLRPDNPRLDFDEGTLPSLALSIKKMGGVIHPVTLNRRPGMYDLLCGARRFKAAQLAGHTTIRADIITVSEEKAIEIMAEENLNRKPLNDIETGRALRMLKSVTNVSNRELGERFGMSPSWSTNLMRLLDLPPHWQQRIVREGFPARAARELLTLSEQSMELMEFAWEQKKKRTGKGWSEAIALAAAGQRRSIERSEAGEYQPWSWFAKHTRITKQRMAAATAPNRKTKRVDVQRHDGHKRYSVADARRLWPTDFIK